MIKIRCNLDSKWLIHVSEGSLVSNISECVTRKAHVVVVEGLPKTCRKTTIAASYKRPRPKGCKGFPCEIF